MMKYFCLLPLLLLAYTVQYQSISLSAFNLEQNNILQVGMLVLGGWAVLNIMVASFRLTTTTRAKRYFYQMNLYWNIINILVAGIALHYIVSSAVETMSLAESVKQHVWYKKILYLNIGLDVGYMMLGAYLKQRSRTSLFRGEQFMGWGKSIILQGFFLLLLDVVLVALLEQQAKKLFTLLPQVLGTIDKF